ncbi:hypothetical protein DPMN_025800 [Dreissena polymorpha]|uniref:Uncharacterized protein n=1 Tax=Dreissena polymorpha TaxID=45954 RepID=A0A9D4LRD4_DREPO|nr:hypothetical protein DPMN_025800 [Dreissena polymorpha]
MYEITGYDAAPGYFGIARENPTNRNSRANIFVKSPLLAQDRAQQYVVCNLTSKDFLNYNAV